MLAKSVLRLKVLGSHFVNFEKQNFQFQDVMETFSHKFPT